MMMCLVKTFAILEGNALRAFAPALKDMEEMTVRLFAQVTVCHVLQVPAMIVSRLTIYIVAVV